MSTPNRTPVPAGQDVPVACTLNAAGLAAQAGRWTQLMAMAMSDRAETPDGLRITFRHKPGVAEELRSLVGVERECCRWAEWSVEATAHHQVLEIRSTGAGIDVLHGMFTGS